MTSPDPTAAAPPPPPAPSLAVTILALLPPLFFPVIGLASLAVVLRGGLLRAIEEAGWSAYLVLLALIVGTLATSVLAALAARGLRVPSVVALFAAVLPWVCGLAGMRIGMHAASRAIAFADPASRATMIAKGLSEAINARILGAWSTAGLAAALGLSFAIGAAGQRAPNRRWAFAAVGLLLVVPVLGVTGYALVSHLLGKAFVLVALLAVGTLLALPLAAGAPAGDVPNGRAAALSTSAVVMLFVAWLAGTATLGSEMLGEAFGAIVNADPSDRAIMLAQAFDEMKIASVIGWVGGGALAVGALVVAGWATTRARPTPGRLAGGGALVVVATLVLVADVFVRSASESDVASTAQPPWGAVAGFAPTALTNCDDPHASPVGAPILLAVDGATISGEHVARSALATDAGIARVAALVRALIQSDPSRTDDASRPEWLPPREDGEDHGTRIRDLPAPDPSVAIAVDRRVDATSLRALARGVAQGGAHSLVLMGVPSRREDDGAARARIAASSPAIAALLEPTVSAPVLLEVALPAGYADADPTLWHATLGAAPSGEIVPRVDADDRPFPFPRPPPSDESIMGRPPEPGAVVYLALGDEATAASLAAAANAVTARDQQPLLVVGPLPGHPEQPLAAAGGAPSAMGILGLLGGGDALGQQFGFDGLGGGLGPSGGSGEGTIGLGNIGTIGHGHGGGGDSSAAPATTVQAGSAAVRGSLAPEVIQRVVRRHINEVRFCYETALRDHPQLEGRVVVQFVIGADGTVTNASVQSSTLSNAAAETCIADAVRRWMFPSPDGGGVVIVTYPFVLAATPGDPPATGPHTGFGHGGGEGYGS